MKAKTKVILGSAMTAAMCASLIAGSTFALFTSESKTNIAITAGKVAVSATIDQDSLNLWSYAEKDGEYVSTEQLDAEGQPTTTFALGGTASFEEDGTLTLTNIVPGDKAEFSITVTNNSTVDVKYQYVLTATGNADLLKELEIKVGETEFVQNAFIPESSSTVWSVWETASDKTKKVEVTVELPYPGKTDVSGTEGSIQGTSCGLSFAVSAIQANANTVDPEEGKLTINSLEEFVAFGKSVETREDGYAGQEIFLKTDIDFNDIKGMGATFALNAGSEVAVNMASEMPLSDDGWAPIGTSAHPFKGTFDGGNHTIKNFTATASDTGARVGLFGYVQGATIQHLKFENAQVSATGENAVAAVVVGEASGALEIKDVTVTGTLETESSAVAGGLVGSLGSDAALTVGSSSFVGTGASDLVGKTEEGATSTITESTLTDDNTGATTEWDKEGNEQAICSVSDVLEFQKLLDGLNEQRKSAKITLSEDLEVDGTYAKPVAESGAAANAVYLLGSWDVPAQKSTKTNLVLDLAGHHLTLKATSGIIFDVAHGSSLKIVNSAEQRAKMDLISSGGTPIKVTGKDNQELGKPSGEAIIYSSLTIENVDIHVQSTYTNASGKTAFSSVINVADKGHTLNFNNVSFEADDSNEITSTSNTYLATQPYIVKFAKGENRYRNVLNMTNVDVTVGGLVTPFIAYEYSEINFYSGTISTSSGQRSAAIGIAEKNATVRVIGSTINITGDTETGDETTNGGGYCRIGIGEIGISPAATDSLVVVSGATFNVKPTNGTAIGVARGGGATETHIGGGTVFHVAATEAGKAGAIATKGAGKVHVYSDITYHVEESENNMKYYTAAAYYNGSVPGNGIVEEATPMPEGYKN